MRILVTGAGGYIGTVLVPMLLEEGHEVVAMDRYFFGQDLLAQHPNLLLVKEDIRRVTAEHMHSVEAVIDLAAISNDPSGELFQDATWSINHRGRVRVARIAKECGVERYVLPSTCSVYGFQDSATISDEDSPTNPLTTYSKANLAAEEDVLAMDDDDFCVVVLRQATVYGLSPRMRFDLAINGMTYGAWNTGRLPLMRDGSQWRPMVHVRDTASAQIHALHAARSLVHGKRFNVGSESNVYQIGPLGEAVARTVPGSVEIEWYGDPDHRSYRVAFDRIESTGWKAEMTAEDGVAEIVDALERGEVDKTPRTITLEWYKLLSEFHGVLRDVEIDGQLLNLEAGTA